MVEIVSHTDGESVGAGIALICAQVDDDDDGAQGLLQTWALQSGSTSLDHELGRNNDNGMFWVETVLPPGEVTVEVTVFDDDANSATDHITLSVRDNEPPTISVVNERGYYATTQEIELDASDPEDGDQVAVAWELNGSSGSGLTVALSDLEVGGQYTLVATVTDSLGAQGSVEHPFEMVNPDLDEDGYLTTLVGGDDCGFQDIAISAPGAKGEALSSGVVYVVMGRGL